MKDIQQLIADLQKDPEFVEEFKRTIATGESRTRSVMYDIKSMVEHGVRQHTEVDVLWDEADVGPHGTEADMALTYRGETYDIMIRRRTSEATA
jgi:hypothetical protein